VSRVTQLDGDRHCVQGCVSRAEFGPVVVAVLAQLGRDVAGLVEVGVGLGTDREPEVGSGQAAEGGQFGAPAPRGPGWRAVDGDERVTSTGAITGTG
jgi:hypothetical protein